MTKSKIILEENPEINLYSLHQKISKKPQNLPEINKSIFSEQQRSISINYFAGRKIEQR